MLRIESIDLKNFKSYRSCFINEISPNVNVICGPNGAGKSGLLESICFVLGLRSSHLRASNLSKLIYNDIQDNSPCEVTITFVVLDGGNVIKRFSISRKVKPSGTSHYYIQKHHHNEKKKEIKLKEIQILLKKYDLDLNFSDRYVFEQLRTVEISEKSDIELLQYIECIIGNDMIKSDISKLESKHKEEMNQLNDVIESIEKLKKEMEKLSQHVDIYDKCESLKNIHQEKMNSLIQLKCNYYKLKENEFKEELNILFSEKNKLQEEITSTINDIEEIESNIDENRLKNIDYDNKINQLRKEINQLTGKKAKLDIYICDYNDEKFKLKMESMEKEILTLQSKINEYYDKMESLNNEKQENKKDDIQKFEKQLRRKYKKSFNEFKATYEEWNRILLKDIDTNELNEIHNKIKKQNESIKKHTQNISEKELKKSECNKEVEEIKQSIELTRHQIEESKKENKMDEKKICEIEKEISTLSPKNIEFESNSIHRYLDAIKFLRKNNQISNDIFGFLFEIASLKDIKYKQAVNSAIGIHSLTNSIVVRTRKAANVVIEYFNRHSIGMLVCYITDELNQKPIRKESYNNVLNLVNCVDVKYSECQCLFDTLLGQFLVCETKEEASNLSYDKKTKIRRNVITINGDLFSKSGEVSSRPKHISWEKYLGLDVRIGSIENLSHDGSNDNEENNKIIEKLTQSLNSLKQKIHDRNVTIKKNEEKIKSYENHLEQVQDTIREIEKEIEDKKHMITKCNDIIRLYNEQIDSYYHQLDNEKKKKLKKEELGRKINELIDKHEDFKHYYQLINKNREAEELKKYNEEKFQILSKEIKIYERKIKSIKKKKDTHISQKNNHEKIKEELDMIELKLNSLMDEEKSLKKEKSDIQSLISSLTNKIKKLKRQERKIKEKKESIQNEIEKVELLLSKTQRKYEQYHSEQYMEIEMTKKSLKKEIKLQEFEITKLEEEIREKEESIDMKAVELYKKHSKELNILNEKMNDLKTSISSILKNIKSLEDKRYNTLVNSIESINKALSEIYSELSIHGDCYLAYPMEMDALFELGISFNVKPDRHQWKTMNELSGGQKAMASLALALSINHVYPSPLLLLDEVDSSLDTNAVERLVDIIYKMSNENERFPQFFIITHRPEFYEKARSLIAVYRYNKSSQTIQWSHKINVS